MFEYSLTKYEFAKGSCNGEEKHKTQLSVSVGPNHQKLCPQRFPLFCCANLGRIRSLLSSHPASLMYIYVGIVGPPCGINGREQRSHHRASKGERGEREPLHPDSCPTIILLLVGNREGLPELWNTCATLSSERIKWGLGDFSPDFEAHRRAVVQRVQASSCS